MTPRAIKNREAIARARIESRCFDCQTETSFTPRGKNDEWYMVRCTTIFGSKLIRQVPESFVSDAWKIAPDGVSCQEISQTVR